LSIEWTKLNSSWQYFIVKYCPGHNFKIKFNKILSMDDISYEILSHGYYFIEDNMLWYTYTYIRRQNLYLQRLMSCVFCVQLFEVNNDRVCCWYWYDCWLSIRKCITIHSPVCW
jgi:hypothetical protein